MKALCNKSTNMQLLQAAAGIRPFKRAIVHFSGMRSCADTPEYQRLQAIDFAVEN